MTYLRKMMLEELERRNYTDGMIRHYLRFVEDFARPFGKSLQQTKWYRTHIKLQPRTAQAMLRTAVYLPAVAANRLRKN